MLSGQQFTKFYDRLPGRARARDSGCGQSKRMSWGNVNQKNRLQSRHTIKLAPSSHGLVYTMSLHEAEHFKARKVKKKVHFLRNFQNAVTFLLIGVIRTDWARLRARWSFLVFCSRLSIIADGSYYEISDFFRKFSKNHNFVISYRTPYGVPRTPKVDVDDPMRPVSMRFMLHDIVLDHRMYYPPWPTDRTTKMIRVFRNT